ncbi:MAG: DUF554 domain-containing protein [Desulfobacterales bacterium CG07_land_8_20_14_0_80_52_14]|nr:MAG: hypothetical protein COX20_05200 [Desulfobacterales bacterium CG23_combo_of_CG06-09_8_20_14_all_52_9]PIU50368.1 MAG: DUF554 domain-containing protein [Desulfobacterales bacterium CG07_land_8_20_14_0_80_52_14]
MIGTWVNTGAIISGGLIGIGIGKRLPERIKTIVMHALGLSTLLIGLQMALSGKKLLLTLGCLLAGAVVGEAVNIEGAVERLGVWLKKRARSDSSSFVEGFVTASVLFCTGAMVIVGSIQDGTTGDTSTLLVKSLLDGMSSIALASSFGIGVAFSGLSVLVVQGTITLLASHLAFLQEPAVLEAVTATGGLLIVGIGFNLVGHSRIRIGNMIPALAFAVLFALFWK